MWKRLILVLAGMIVGLCSLGYTAGQQVIQPAAPGTVQVQPPGAVGTTQIPFVLSTSSGGAAVATVTVPALGGKQIYVTSLQVMGDGATGQSIIALTAGWGGTTFATYQYNVVAGATTANPQFYVSFPTPITAGSPGQNFVWTVPSFGAGNTASSSVVTGFYQ